MKDSKSKQKKSSVQGQLSQKTSEPETVQAEKSSLGSEGGNNDDSGVDEKGMERLMAALGEDGLDDIAQNMLKALDEDEDINDDEDTGQSEVESSDADEKENSEVSEDDEDDGVDEYVPKVKLRAGLSSDEDDEDDDDEEEDEDEESGEEDGDEENKSEDEDENETQDAKKAAKVSKSSTSKQSTKLNTSEKGELGVALDEVSDVDEDAIPQQQLMVNNKRALERILASIQLDKSLPWTETLTTVYPEAHDVDVSDDLERELSFYKQALHCAEAAKKLAAEHSFPFTRPSDFFAEMVKSDSHMERTRQRLLDETAQIKRGEDKRREREGKKFGKQVQLEKLKERERGKKELSEKIQGLKRKRKSGALDGGDDGDFDVALEEAVEDRPKKKSKMPRGRRDEKYGFGGKGSVGWRSKQNTRDSTDQFVSGKSGKKEKKGGKHVPKQRPGKARRMSNRQK